MTYLRFAYAAGLLLLWGYATLLWLESRRLAQAAARQNRMTAASGEQS